MKPTFSKPPRRMHVEYHTNVMYDRTPEIPQKDTYTLRHEGNQLFVSLDTYLPRVVPLVLEASLQPQPHYVSTVAGQIIKLPVPIRAPDTILAVRDLLHTQQLVTLLVPLYGPSTAAGMLGHYNHACSFASAQAMGLPREDMDAAYRKAKYTMLMEAHHVVVVHINPVIDDYYDTYIGIPSLQQAFTPA